MQKEMSGRNNTRSGCMKAPLIAIILLLTSAASILVYSEPLVVPPSRENSSNVFPDEDLSYQLAEQLISLLGPSHEQTIAALYGIEQDEELSDSVSEILLSGEEAAAEAFALFGEGSYEEAMELATTAMQLYGDAIRTAVEAELEEDEEDAAEDEAMKSIELSGEIERDLSYIDKVRKTVTRLEKKDVDISDYEALVDEAEEHLLLAEEMLDDDDMEGAEAEESAAMEILDEVMGLLRRESEESKTEKASKFIDKNAERLDKLENRITEKI
jgi:tetratricopeptide (TPR) repeat protein